MVDAGPLIALIDTAHAAIHQKCVAAVNAISQPVVTTLPCFTEAMYFLGEIAGWRGQAALWRYVEAQQLTFHSQTADEWLRIRELMEQYRDTPMDFADASLVSLAEARGLRRILTLDSDFYVYRN